MTTFNRQTKYSKVLPEERLPSWIKPGIGKASQLEKVQKLVKRNRLHTICEEGRCPNRSECYASGTASFLLGGSICTRSCAFCQVEKGKSPQEVDVNEAKRVAQAIQQLKLNYVVLTAVARDDLHDHGASIFTETIVAIRELVPNINIEVLTPDFWGGSSNEDTALRLQKERLAKVLSAKPVCFNHNLETVERLQKEVRRGATYRRSLGLLKTAKELAPKTPTKSGLMLGLGETLDEIIKTLKDLRDVNCQQVTIGQYLRPSLSHLPVHKYWHPSEFDDLADIAKNLGFLKVNSGPLVRSSYHAEES
ncbi:lipoyl synthase [Prochlorococcus marinus]|uniref:Lipoyl synthase n=1 Tax=Prochlorococcus marinus (strain MIT 9211) TaxID=93059 RepID=A9BB09_PROM4|nr:lipoyl synthase [Prochlorococcus marinus]ABX09021.1 Lipoate synthase [Prochlorococcus marinus str. MIT 9211]